MQPQTVITRDNFIKRLEEAVPNFKIDPDWTEDNILYLVINDLARYICQEAEIGLYVRAKDCGFEEVEKALGFLERCLETREQDMRDLVHDCLEGIASCNQIAEIKTHFGPGVRDLWKQIPS